MSRMEVSIPSLLADCAGGRTRFEVAGETLREAVERLFSEYPLLKHHVYNEAGQVRRHVLLYYNDQNIDWLPDLNIRLGEGDRFLVLQAVSGG